MRPARYVDDRVGVKILISGRWFWYRGANGEPAEVSREHGEWMARQLGGPEVTRLEMIVRDEGWQGDAAEEEQWVDRERLVNHGED